MLRKGRFFRGFRIVFWRVFSGQIYDRKRGATVEINLFRELCYVLSLERRLLTVNSSAFRSVHACTVQV